MERCRKWSTRDSLRYLKTELTWPLSEGSESSEVNENGEEVETSVSDPGNVEEVPEYDSSTDEDEEPEDRDSNIPSELDHRPLSC